MKKSDSYNKNNIEDFIEEAVIFSDIIKWSILSIIVGVIVGVSVTLFLKILTTSIKFTNHFPYYFLILPIIFLFNTYIVRKLTPNSLLSEEDLLDAIHNKNGKISPLNAPLTVLTTILTIIFGGSSGKEGPAAQLGGGLISTLAQIFKINKKDFKKLVICGISAGFSSIFGTPIAGAIFGVEILYVGELKYDYLLPPFISGIISYLISRQLHIHYLYQNIDINLTHLNLLFLFKIILSGIFFGLISLLFIKLISTFQKLVKKSNLSFYTINIIGALILILVGFIDDTYLGMKIHVIDSMLRNELILPLYAPFLKIFTTAITITTGGKGGLITPIYFIGASAGQFFATIFHLNTQFFAALGLVAVIAGTTNTPISSAIMALELFGPKFAPYAAIGIYISFLMTGHRSLYTNQILKITKSDYIQIEKEKELNKINKKEFKGKIAMFLNVVINKLKNLFN